MSRACGSLCLYYIFCPFCAQSGRNMRIYDRFARTQAWVPRACACSSRVSRRPPLIPE